MKKTSNWIITIGIILTVIICLYKFFDFSSLKIPNLESKYLWWGLGAIIVVILGFAISKSTPSTSTSSSSSSSSNFAGSLWGFVKVVAGFAVFVVVLGLLIAGLGWIKGSIDNWTESGGNTAVGELVTLVPGSYATIPISSSTTSFTYDPPEMTRVEFLDENGEPLPIYKNGMEEYSSITGPGVDNNIMFDDKFKYIRFSGTGSNSEYSFMFYQN